MLSAEEIYELARKFVFDEKLTAQEEEQKKEVLKTRSYYIQYCAGVALLDMMERKGEYEPRYSIRNRRDEKQTEGKKGIQEQETTGEQG